MPVVGERRNRAGTFRQSLRVLYVRGWETRALPPAGDFRSGPGNRPAAHWIPQYRRPGSFVEVPPSATVALDQFVGLFRSPCSGRVVRKIPRRQRLPQIENWIDDTPPGLNHV